MLNISKAKQFIVPGQDIALSALPSSEKSKVISIRGEANSGALVMWTPTSALPPLMILRANRAYAIESVLTGPSFVPYTLSVADGGTHAQNNQITKTFQFLTYRGASNFDLNSLASSVKSKIIRIYGSGSTAASNFRVWAPDDVIPILRYLLPGMTYLVESNSQGFVSYDLGIPMPESSSSSSSGYQDSSSSSEALDASSSSSADEASSLYFLNDGLIPDAGFIS
jgi:hypothetical protein